MDKEKLQQYMVDLKGKMHITYGGLLALAHEAGLKSICARLVQTPTPDNDFRAICTATVVMADDRVFEEIGDASPKDVQRHIAVHIIRMAATRAKARALRDAVNVGEAAVEEFGGDDELQGASASLAASSAPHNGHSAAVAQDRKTTPAQTQNPALCPSCHAPAGKPHSPQCKAQASTSAPVTKVDHADPWSRIDRANYGPEEWKQVWRGVFDRRAQEVGLPHGENNRETTFRKLFPDFDPAKPSRFIVSAVCELKREQWVAAAGQGGKIVVEADEV